MSAILSTEFATSSFGAWLAKSETLGDTITAHPLNALAATFDRVSPEGIVPALWNWLYFLPIAPMSKVGKEGHPTRGSFLPPVPLPRPMSAGGHLTFHGPMRAGQHATRTSTIADIEDKTGRSGRLVFVAVRHRYEADDKLRIEEEQDIVYRDAPKRVAAPEGETWTRTLIADPVLLFRYSALTFNAHRIHYDLPYTTQEEGYPGPIVHGPLLADLVHRERPGATLATFAFRAVRPTFAGQTFTLCGKPWDDGRTVELWAKDHEGYLKMQATATLA